ncbi:MAG TPA: YetF domain-containing protein [Bacillota bacterium]|nr:YetF domain-containing protein [Bacillota bacterium]
MIRDILWGSSDLPVTSIIIRSTLLYISVIIGTRLMGKRQVGIISGHNYLVAAGIVSLVAVRMVNPNTSLISGFIIVFTYALLNRFWSYLDLKYPGIVDRRPVTLVEHGTILYGNLKMVQLSVEDLLMQLRQKGVWNLSAVHQVYLEPTGEISVLKKDAYSPVTVKDMGITTQPLTNPPQLVSLKQAESGSIGYIVNPDGSQTYIRKG